MLTEETLNLGPNLSSCKFYATSFHPEFVLELRVITAIVLSDFMATVRIGPREVTV